MTVFFFFAILEPSCTSSACIIPGVSPLFLLVTACFDSYHLAISPSGCINLCFTLSVPQSHMWAQTSQILSSLPPKRDCGPERVNLPPPLQQSVPCFCGLMKIYNTRCTYYKCSCSTQGKPNPAQRKRISDPWGEDNEEEELEGAQAVVELSKKAKHTALALLPAAEGAGTGDAEGVVVKRQGGAAGSAAGAGVGEGGDDFVTSPAKPGKNAKRPVRRVAGDGRKTRQWTWVVLLCASFFCDCLVFFSFSRLRCCCS